MISGRLGVALAVAALSAGAALASPPALDASLRAAIGERAALRGELDPERDLAGRVTVVTFFASWCPPCRPEFEHLNTLAGETSEQAVTILAINVFEDWDGDDPARLAQFLSSTAPRFPVLSGDAALRRLFGGVERIPTVMVFSASGAPVADFVHARGATVTHADIGFLRTAVKRALAAP